MNFSSQEVPRIFDKKTKDSKDLKTGLTKKNKGMPIITSTGDIIDDSKIIRFKMWSPAEYNSDYLLFEFKVPSIPEESLRQFYYKVSDTFGFENCAFRVSLETKSIFIYLLHRNEPFNNDEILQETKVNLLKTIGI